MSELDSQLESLFRARPELRLALPYLVTGEEAAQLALASIERQWVDAVYRIEEASVASSKLHWWADELRAAREGHTHHPLATALFVSERARAIEPSRWLQAVEAGLALREQAPARDFDEQVAVATRFHGVLAELETMLCFGPDADPTRAGRVASLGHLLSAQLHLGKSRSDNDLLPMQRQARHGLDRNSQSQDTAARAAAVREQLVDLQKAFADAMSLAGPLSLARELGCHADRAQLRRALHAHEPLAVLAGPRGRLGPAMAFKAWRAGRRHRQTINGTKQ